jgi:transposase
VIPFSHRSNIPKQLAKAGLLEKYISYDEYPEGLEEIRGDWFQRKQTWARLKREAREFTKNLVREGKTEVPKRSPNLGDVVQLTKKAANDAAWQNVSVFGGSWEVGGKDGPTREAFEEVRGIIVAKRKKWYVVVWDEQGFEQLAKRYAEKGRRDRVRGYLGYLPWEVARSGLKVVSDKKDAYRRLTREPEKPGQYTRKKRAPAPKPEAPKLAPKLQRAVELLAAGMTAREVAKELGVYDSQIRKWMNHPDFESNMKAQGMKYSSKTGWKAKSNPTPQWLPLSSIQPVVAEMEAEGVSEVARSKRGFLTAYKRVRGDVRKLGRDPAFGQDWVRRRNNFVARHMAQIRNRKEPLWVDGRPSRRHLALIAWAYSPTEAKLKKYTQTKRNPRGSDIYDPREEQLRAQRQAIYESSLLRDEPQLKFKSFRNTKGKRLDQLVVEEGDLPWLRKYLGKKMFQIGVGVQKRDRRLQMDLFDGYLVPSKKTIAESKKRYADVDKLTRNRQDYEESLALMRKSSFYRVTKEPTRTGWKYFVWPMQPGQRIPKGFESKKRAENVARLADRDAPTLGGRWWKPSRKKYTKQELRDWLPPETVWRKK